MADHHRGPIIGSQVLDNRVQPMPNVLKRLPIGRTQLKPIRPLHRLQRRPPVGDILKKLPLPVPKSTLAEDRRFFQNGAGNVGNRIGGLSSTVEVAAENSADPLAKKPLPQKPSLLQAFWVKRNIRMPLRTLLGIPRSLAMPNQVKAHPSIVPGGEDWKMLRMKVHPLTDFMLDVIANPLYKYIDIATETADVGENVGEKHRLLDLLKQQPTLSAKELATLLNKTSRTVERYLRELREQGRLKRVGPDKGGYWEVVESD